MPHRQRRKPWSRMEAQRHIWPVDSSLQCCLHWPFVHVWTLLVPRRTGSRTRRHWHTVKLIRGPSNAHMSVSAKNDGRDELSGILDKSLRRRANKRTAKEKKTLTDDEIVFSAN